MMCALVAAGVKGIPSSKYLAIDSTMCDISRGQFGTGYKFKQHECIQCKCADCGKTKLKVSLDDLNSELLKVNKVVTWHRWEKTEGHTAPQKCVKKKPVRTALNEFLMLIEDLLSHYFQSSWHCGILNTSRRI